MSVASRTDELLALIAAHRDTGCETVLDQARQRAGAALSDAAAAARRRMREAFAQERRHAAERVGAAQARLDTRRRILDQHRAQALLAAAWQRLPAALQDRWQDPRLRAAWVTQATNSARGLLGTGAWRIAHPTDWPVAEQRALEAGLRGQGIGVEFNPDVTISAGLRIHAGPNLIDGTSQGLLADRAEIGARVLYALEQAR